VCACFRICVRRGNPYSAEEQLKRAGQAARRELQEQYLRLMCEYEKGQVLGYLEWLDTSGEIMPPIDFCLRVRRTSVPSVPPYHTPSSHALTLPRGLRIR
jgi:hypothetical protein